VRGACIDIGSNTTRLLVADVSDGALDKLQEHRVFTHLRRDVQRHRAIAAGTLSELVDVVAYQPSVRRRSAVPRTPASLPACSSDAAA
jgi:exopolyphosphatase/guanosine-5'-triphosphate,3'-diphosphate pyrophosphatase